MPELGERVRLKRQRRQSGYTMVRVTKITRALLEKLEARHDEPLDALVFYMACEEMNLDYAALIPQLACALKSKRRGIAPAAGAR